MVLSNSVRLKVLSMYALYSLSHNSPEILRNGRFKNLIIKRLSDGEETVVRAALKIGRELAEVSRNLPVQLSPLND